MFLGNDARTYAPHCLALRDGDVRAITANIACPTLLTVGDQDLVTPMSWQRQIAAAIANSRIRIIPNTAHMTMLESPAVFNTVVIGFLGDDCSLLTVLDCGEVPPTPAGLSQERLPRFGCGLAKSSRNTRGFR